MPRISISPSAPWLPARSQSTTAKVPQSSQARASLVTSPAHLPLLTTQEMSLALPSMALSSSTLALPPSDFPLALMCESPLVLRSPLRRSLLMASESLVFSQSSSPMANCRSTPSRSKSTSAMAALLCRSQTAAEPSHQGLQAQRAPSLARSRSPRMILHPKSHSAAPTR